MLRKLVTAAFGLVLVAGIVRAEDLNLNGKIKSVDVDGKSLVVTPDDKAISDTTFKVTDTTSIVRKSKDGEKDVKDGLKGLKEGRAVTVTYVVKDKDNVASKILVTSFGRGPKKEEPKKEEPKKEEPKKEEPKKG